MSIIEIKQKKHVHVLVKTRHAPVGCVHTLHTQVASVLNVRRIRLLAKAFVSTECGLQHAFIQSPAGYSLHLPPQSLPPVNNSAFKDVAKPWTKPVYNRKLLHSHTIWMQLENWLYLRKFCHDFIYML